MWNKLNKFKTYLWDFLFPQFCLKCQKEGFLLCYDCLTLIEINPFQYCPFCPFPNRVLKNGKCQTHQNFKLNGLFSATSYQNTLVKKMIALLKYKPYIKNFVSPLSALIISHFALLEKQQIFKNNAAVFVPVPISRKKERERGYNQSAVLSKILSQYYNLPLQTKNLIKVKNTQSQVGLSKQQRQENVFGAFAVRKTELIKNKTIFLIDDVFTTGATMEECAKTLKVAGAKKVFGIAVAREGLAQ